MSAINCRSRKARDCLHGRPESEVYGVSGQHEDGTWDGESIVCDACYIAIGQPSVPYDSPEARTFPATIEGGKGRPTRGGAA